MTKLGFGICDKKNKIDKLLPKIIKKKVEGRFK